MPLGGGNGAGLPGSPLGKGRHAAVLGSGQRAEQIFTRSTVISGTPPQATFVTGEPCLFYGAQTINVNAASPGIIATFRHGNATDIANARIFWILTQGTGAGVGTFVAFYLPIYCPTGFSVDFAGSGATGTYGVNVQYLLLTEHVRYRQQEELVEQVGMARTARREALHRQT